jgi:asparagine synthetase B (glutamine-hydrolysing)
MGVHPISYIIESNSLIFSTDFISLSRFFGSKEPIDQNYLLSLYKNINLKITPYHKIVKLLPGNYIEFSNLKIKTTRYWQPESIKIDSFLNHHNYLNEIRTL